MSFLSLKKYLKHQKQLFFYTLFFLSFLVIGYYLRSYFTLTTFLPGSPYEHYVRPESYFGVGGLDSNDFAGKLTLYPVTPILGFLFKPIDHYLYLVFLVGGLVIFLLTYEITTKKEAGLLAFALLAVSHENFMIYLSMLSNSGLSYVFILLSLFFLLRYFKKKPYGLLPFILSSILVLLTYHTGALAFLFILYGIVFSLLISKRIDIPFFTSVGFLSLFLGLWIIFYDFSTYTVLKNFLSTLSLSFLFFGLISTLLFASFLYLIRNFSFFQSEYFYLGSLVISLLLIFSTYNFFGFLLNLGISHYYVSSITLNNYIGQFLLLHIYGFAFLSSFFTQTSEPKILLLRGWLIGVCVVFVNFFLNGYLPRILDYSYPLAWIFFILYWQKHIKFRSLIITLTLVLFILSQLFIFQDPYSMRRYYTENEVTSAQEIIDLSLSGVVASDLRTVALFTKYYYSQDATPIQNLSFQFSEADQNLHTSLFYDLKPLPPDIHYVVLSDAMYFIVYAMNFETTPLTKEVFTYYDTHYPIVYDSSVFTVYNVTKN